MNNSAYKEILSDIFKAYNVRKTDYTDSANFSCNTLVYREGNGYYIVVKRGLPEEVEFFSLVHEVGHIAMGHLFLSPFQKRSKKTEMEINLWALDFIKPYISDPFYQILHSLFKRSENEAFFYLKKELKNNFSYGEKFYAGTNH